MYSPANRVFSFSKWGGGGSILIMCTQCALQLPETNTFYMQCILGVIILIIIWLKKMTIIKLCFFFLWNSVLCIWLSNEGIKHKFHLSLNYWKWNFFLANKGNLLLWLKIKMLCDYSLKNKVFIILVVVVVVVCTFCWTNISSKTRTFILTGCREPASTTEWAEW